MSIQRTIAFGAGLAAAVYGGLAARNWLTYGHSALDGYSPLDPYMANPEAADRHTIEVAAPATVSYDACCEYDLVRSPVARLLFATRAILLCGTKDDQALPTTLPEQMKTAGWEVFETIPGNRIVVGAAAKPWLADPHFRALDAKRFKAFDEPGWAKIVWCIKVEPQSTWHSVIRTETRVVTTDAISRRIFRRYWSLALPGIVLLRLISLREIKANAEKIATALATA